MRQFVSFTSWLSTASERKRKMCCSEDTFRSMLKLNDPESQTDDSPNCTAGHSRTTLEAPVCDGLDPLT